MHVPVFEEEEVKAKFTLVSYFFSTISSSFYKLSFIVKFSVSVDIVPTPQTESYPQQTTVSVGGEYNQPPSYNYGSSSQNPHSYGVTSPPPYSVQPQPFYQYQNPSYPTNQYQSNPPPAPQAGWKTDTNNF